MKLKKISLAIAAAVAASQASALAPTATLDTTLTVSGSTAADKQFLSYVTGICDAATLDYYNNPSDTASGYSCTIPGGTVTGIASNINVLFRKESGGSSHGVEPVTNKSTVVGLNLSTCHDDGANGDTTAGDHNWICSDTTINVPAEVGISDVEPELFKIPANGAKNVNTSVDMYVVPANAQIFGVVVTPDLRDALQSAQGLTVGSDAVDQMPSLSSDVIANIFAGNVASWSQLTDSTGAGISVADDAVNVCVRTPGSGTQAQFNAYYMGNACAYRGASTYQFLGMNTAIDTDGGENDINIPTFFGSPLPPPYVHKNHGSSDMGKCLTNLAAAGRTGIGIQGLEKVDEGRTDRNNFKFIAVDGVTPTLENTASGLYQDWATLSIQWLQGADTVPSFSALDQKLAAGLVAAAQDVAAVHTFNLSLQDDDPAVTEDDRPLNGWRTPEILNSTSTAPINTGSLALQGAAGASVSVPWSAANPVLPFNKGLSGPSACKVAVMPGNVTVDVSNKN